MSTSNSLLRVSPEEVRENGKREAKGSWCRKIRDPGVRKGPLKKGETEKTAALARHSIADRREDPPQTGTSDAVAAIGFMSLAPDFRCHAVASPGCGAHSRGTQRITNY